MNCLLTSMVSLPFSYVFLFFFWFAIVHYVFFFEEFVVCTFFQYSHNLC